MARWSISKIRDYQECPHKYFLKHEVGLRRVVSDPSAMDLGSLVHEGLAAAMREYYYMQLDPVHGDDNSPYSVAYDAIDTYAAENIEEEVVAIIPSEEGGVPVTDVSQNWKDMVKLARTIVTRTLEHLDFPSNYEVVGMETAALTDFGTVGIETVLEQIEYDGEAYALELENEWFYGDTAKEILDKLPYEVYSYVPAVELKIEAPFFAHDEEHTFSGIIDAVLYNKNTGHVELVDWKTRSRLYSYQDEVLKMQTVLYQEALDRQYGIETSKATIYQIASWAPTVPSVNKDGSVSVRKIKSDWDTYLEVLLEQGEDPDDYYEMKFYFDELQPERFDPITIYRSSQFRERLWLEFIYHVERIIRDTVYVHAYNYSCSRCPFHQWCVAEATDIGLEDLLGTNYDFTDRNTIVELGETITLEEFTQRVRERYG